MYKKSLALWWFENMKVFPQKHFYNDTKFHMSLIMKRPDLCTRKNKCEDSCVADQSICFHYIVQPLYFLYQ